MTGQNARDISVGWFALVLLSAAIVLTAISTRDAVAQDPARPDDRQGRTDPDASTGGPSKKQPETLASDPPEALEPLEHETVELIRAAEMTPRQVLAHVGLEPPSDATCRDFSETSRLVERTRRWTRAARILARTHPDMLFGWLLGTERPPEYAVREVERQRNCLLDQLVADSRSKPSLTVNLEIRDHEITSKRRLQRWAEAYQHSSYKRRKMRGALTESRHRTALSQGYIWRRKFLFRGRSFNRISEEAARKCQLPAGHSWRPKSTRHRRCWREVLTGSDRQREILSASSAPGVSRHHWGTEIDLFGLDPVDFRPQNRLHDEYRWMRQHALGFGFFQSYGASSETYMEERWHWSYFPIAQALTEFAGNHRPEVDRRLNALWDRLAAKFNRGRIRHFAYFSHIRENWEPYMFDITVPMLPETAEPDAERARRGERPAQDD